MTDAIIAINRFGLGGRAGEKLPDDPKRWLLNQIDAFDPAPAPISARPSSKAALASHIAYRGKQRERRRMRQSSNAENPAMDALNEERVEMRRSIRGGYLDDIAARGLTALQSGTPFMERLTHFWSNHFAVSVRKNQVRALAGPYEFEAIRPNITGSFSNLLKASVLHPAMLIYLDQARSVGPNSVIGERARNRRNRELGLNENLAREILELHTLGVRSGYTQEDVTEFARAMTGWTISGDSRARRATVLPNGTAYAERLHEPGKRTVLGSTYSDNGGQQALSILDDLAAHPATAKHVATKLARHFSADDPPPAMVARLEKAFFSSGGDLPTVYRALIASPEAWATEQQKFRQPWEWMMASLRATGADTLGRRGFLSLLRELGQMTWAPTSPAGYDDTMASWAGPDALIRRVEAAERIANRYRTDDVPALARQLFGGMLNDTTATWLSRAESSTQAMALLLASPEMMRR